VRIPEGKILIYLKEKHPKKICPEGEETLTTKPRVNLAEIPQRAARLCRKKGYSPYSVEAAQRTEGPERMDRVTERGKVLEKEGMRHGVPKGGKKGEGTVQSQVFLAGESGHQWKET